MKFSFDTNIAFRLARLTAIVAISIGLIISFTQVYFDFMRQQKQQENTVARILRVEKPAATEIVYTLDSRGARELLKGLLQYDFIISATIIDEMGILLATESHPKIKASPTRAITNLLFKDETQTFTLPLYQSDTKNIQYGELTIIIDRDIALQDFYYRSLFVVVSGLFRNMVFAFILFGVFYAYLTKPLIKIAAALKSIRPDRLDDMRIPVIQKHEKDELGLVVKYFNELFDTIQYNLLKRKHVEKILKESEEKYRLMVEHSNDMIWTLDASGNFTFFNKRTEEMTGLRLKDWLGKPFFSLLLESELQTTKNAFKRVLEGESLQHDFQLKLLDEGSFIISANSAPIITDGNVTGVVSFAQDVTKRKQAEMALKKSEEKYRRLSENVPAIVYEFKMDTDGAFSFPYINSSVTAIMGIAAEDIMNDAAGFLDLIHPDDQKTFLERVQKSAESLGLYHEVIRYSKNGEERWVEARSTPDRMADGSVIWNGFLIDITDKKNAESERHALEARLQQSQKMESIGTLAGGIAHDFNNILTPIIGYADMLKDALPSGSPNQKSAQEIFNAGRRGGELVRQILVLSRQTEHKLAPVYFQAILKEVYKLTRSTIPSDIAIHLDIDKSCGMVMADATQLHQIAMNLITNAYHAVEEASGVIVIQLKEIVVEKNDLMKKPIQPGRYVMLSVSDNGVGIPKAILNKIFEPYFTTKKTGKGTGLGLAVVYGILNEHNGHINVYSEEGKGTTFNVYLPLIETPVEAVSTEKVLTKQTGNESILLVDDEESIVELEKTMLERLGYRVSTQSNSLDALAAFTSNPHNYDLVISDMTMPGMTGDQLAKELMSIRPGIPIIICTGFSGRMNKERADALNIKGFLMKPVLNSELAQMVRKILDNAQAE